MKLLCLALVLVWVKIVTPLHCRCTGLNCDSDLMDTCYTVHSCFTKTNEGNTTYGCVQNLGVQKLFCNKHVSFIKLKCCTTDLCNNNGFPSKPYLPVPSIKLASLVKRTVKVNIADSFKVRAKINGYVATIYTPGVSGLTTFKILAPDTRIFKFNNLFVNTTYVIEVTSYRGRVASERSKPIPITIATPVCDYYKKGDISGKKTETCKSFGCISTWAKNGTILTLLERGCWNDVSVTTCKKLLKFVVCTCTNKSSCTPKTKT